MGITLVFKVALHKLLYSMILMDEIKQSTHTPDTGDGYIQSSLVVMRRKYIWPFLISIVLLIFSEYFFLNEIYGRSNIGILVLTGTGVALNIFFIVSLIRKFN